MNEGSPLAEVPIHLLWDWAGRADDAGAKNLASMIVAAARNAAQIWEQQQKAA